MYNHSEECKKLSKIKFENYQDIWKENNNFNEYKKSLIEILNKNSLITYRYKTNYNYLKVCYKEFNTINQLFDLFLKKELFCFKYNILEGCSHNMSQREDYLSNVLFYDNILIDLYIIEELIYFRLKNDNNICPLRV